uniref:Uncharacterized protein n=1 Tax=candidate division WOR-3 bacterium TaxID=2052148 RepID=A0A7C6A932_UNCW3
MNSLVWRIFLIFAITVSGYATDSQIILNNQNTEKNAVLENSLEQVNRNFGLRVMPRPFLPEGKSDSALLSSLAVELSATEWNWRVRRTGVFAAQVLDCRVQSPYDVLVDFNGFGNLSVPNSDIQIKTYYAISQSAPPPPRSNTWIPANMLNFADFLIPAPIGNTNWNLWCMIEVTDNIKAGEYWNKPTITFVLSGVSEWIEPELLSSERQLGLH